MNACCRKRLVSKDSATPVRRGIAASAWLVPGSLLVLMPKCPVCVAGYVALLTGVGISIPAASGLRSFLIASSIAVLALLVFRLAKKIRAGRSPCDRLSP